MADIPFEGNNPFESEPGNEDLENSPSETNDPEETQSPEGEKPNTQDDPDKDIPFHQHPRWKDRETEWDKRFNDQESRHQDDLRKLREEFAGAKKTNAEETEVPSWFGGSKEQWDAYRKDRDAEIKSAEERAYERITSTKSAEDKAVKEATDYMNSELTAIESDKTLNPKGAKIDPNKLLKIVMDNDLVDSKGRWNYRAGYAIMQNQANSSAPKPGDRKAIAGATTSESKADDKPANYKTSADFKKVKPW